jgi:hypothetical protein
MRVIPFRNINAGTPQETNEWKVGLGLHPNASHSYKETASRDFLLQVFHESSPPKSLKITLGSIQILSENSRRYSQVQVHQWYQGRQWRITTYINNTGGKFPTGATVTAQMGYSGAWGKLIHKKT